MPHKNTVAIIGASGSLGSAIAKGISKGPYRLLLMDKEQNHLSLLASEIIKLNSSADVDIIHCCKDASWEAEIIIIAVPDDEQNEIAKKIKEVATQKIVISIASQIVTDNDLQQLLSYSKVINVSIGTDTKQASNINKTIDAFIKGSDDESLETAIKIIETIGFNPVVKSKTALTEL